MTLFDSVFDYWTDHRVIYCRQCRFCPVPDQCLTHLRKHHPEISPATRRQIAVAVQKREDVARQLHEVIYPQPFASPIKGLVVYTDAFQCTGQLVDGVPCEEIRRHLGNMKEHCRQDHGWVNEQKRGGNARGKQRQAPNRMWKDGIRCQRFFEFAKWKRYFPVEADEFSLAQVHDLTQRAEKLLHQQHQAVDEFRKKQAVEADDNRYEANAWLDRAGWAKHLTMYRRDELIEMVEHPRRVGGDEKEVVVVEEGDEPELWRACQTTVRVIEKAQKVCHPTVTGFHALEYVNRRECGARDNEKPFYGGQMKSSMVKYRRHFTRILCYIWRTFHQEDPKPPYRLTNRQIRCFERFREAISDFEDQPLSRSTQRERLEEACLKFWIALMDHELKDHEYDNALVSGAAVLGWDPIANKWRSATRYTSVLSGMITVGRMLVVYHAHHERRQEIQRHQRDGDTEEEAHQRAPSHFQLVKEMVERFMTLTKYGGQPSPLNWFMRLRTYGTMIRYNTSEDGMISWHHDEIQCGSVRFTMSELRRMVHGLVDQARTRLRRDLLLLDVDASGEVVPGRTPLPPLNLELLYDNPSETREGWSFLDDPRNHFAVDGKTWLYRRIIREPALRNRFIEAGEIRRAEDPPDATIPWRWKEVQRLFDFVTAEKQDLLVLVQMTCGGSLRGSEIPTVQFRNSATGGPRGGLISGGMVQLTTGYHKGFSLSGRVKIVHRFLPREVGELWVYYCWLVQPLVELFQTFRDGQHHFGPWIWEPRSQEGNQLEDDDGEWDDDEDDDTREEEEEEDLPASFEQIDLEEDTIIHDDGRPEQQARVMVDDPPEPRASTVDGFWNSARVTYTLQRATLAGMGVKVAVMSWRHIVKSIMREYSRDRRVHEVLNDDHDVGSGGQDGGLGDGTHDDIRDRQFGHSSHIAGMIYGRDLMEAPFHTVRQREGFRRVSMEWHRFLQFASAMDTTFPHPSIRGLGSVRVGVEVEQEQVRRWRLIQQADLRGSLRWLMNDATAEFRGRQEEVLRAILARQSPIVAIMGTSVGKSLLFMLPAAMNPASVTVVIVPLISLRDNMRERCEKLGIRCVTWQASCPADGAQIVLVTPEAATGEGFHHFINRQRALGKLERIVWDESHVVMDSVDGWRPRVRQLIELSQHQTQLVYLTATLAPDDETSFFGMIGVRASEVKMFRDPTTRRNIQYQVMPCEIGDEDETMIRLVAEKKKQYPLPGQIIIYCGRVDRTVALARLLQCSVYHREVGDAQEKRRILARLTMGTEQVFTATNALGLGIDRGSIRVVIHEGVPRRMRDFAQESGRAGRDGQASESIILVPCRPRGPGGSHRSRPQISSQVEKSMQSYVRGIECRRVVLDRTMDGRQDRIGCDEEATEEACDVCSRRRRWKRRRDEQDDIHAVRPSASKKIRREMMDEIGDIEAIEDTTGVAAEPVMEDVPVVRALDFEGRPSAVEEERRPRQSSFSAEQRRAGLLCAFRRRQRQMEGTRAQELAAKLGRWHDRCAWCVLHGQAERDHSVWDCEVDGAEEIRQRSGELLGQMRNGRCFEKYSACFDCGIPQALCAGWQVRRQGGYRRPMKDAVGGERDEQAGVGCQFRAYFHVGVIVAVVEYGPEVIQRAMMQWSEEEDHITAGQMTEMEEMRWLGRKVRWGEMEMSQMMCQFYRCATLLEEWEQ